MAQTSQPENSGKTVLSVRGAGKFFPGVKALQNVDFDLQEGEIHALLGENGAGKSTLIKVITGVHPRDAGSVTLNGQEIHPNHPGDAQALGISTVFQEVNLIPTLSVAENLMLERQTRKFGLIAWKKTDEDAKAALEILGLDIDIHRPLGSYSVAIQQLVAIARAVALDARVLILDEPTASLDAEEIKTLFAIMRDLKAKGLGIVFVTHFLDQVYAVTDRITVLRNGELVGTFVTKDLPQIDLINHMLGHELAEVSSHRHQDEGNYTGPKRQIQVKNLGKKRVLEPVSLDLQAGEIVGLAGLLGSGRTELSELIFGTQKADSGLVFMDGEPVMLRSPRHAIRAGFGLCPEDRKQDGIVAELSVRENIMLALQGRRGWLRPIPRNEQQKLADDMIKALGIATPDSEKPVGQLSGGNQQKVILARWLVSKPLLLILDEPTRGIDVGAHADIIKLIKELCDEGLALLVASSELDEIVAFADRVAVMRDREKVSELTGAEITQENIIEAIAR
ncbi:sugar ABC transporter ATP-binding protein [Thalassospira lucentensis]|uniref:sugar ABC transporter ATP-binding protein n=1 Tax=Thalassospira lucentensis TaxID=168935 RepID=UPI00142E0DAA|nr:sugar ABC transporter ATP-binding protein [Thalassospira lucentensis]NIZ01961.1 sugar ABC transporter ATP-binding protein [Thalassospira lucentensis]